MFRTLLILAIVAGGASSACAQTPRKPNIIFILADDLGYGDLGCYGQKKIKTPNLDRLAAQGMRFTQAYAGSTVCAPSRCVLMTGKHTGHATIRGNALVPLRPEDVTIATLLKRAGYVTGLIGKWGLGEPGSTGVPTKQGFDSFFGYLNQVHAHNYYPDHLWRNEEKVPLQGNVVVKNVATKRAQYSHDLFADEALRFVEKNKAKPFFLYLAFTIPHANNEAGKLGMEVPSDEPYSKEPWPQPQRNHAAMISRMDRDIGRLLEKLRDLGLDDETIVFFASDNGPHQEGGGDPLFFQSSGPLRGIKRSLHEGGVRIPMIVRWPGKIPAGATNPHVWAFWDFLPTAAELAGAQTPKDIDGISIVPTLLRQGQQPTHDFLYWEFHEKGFQQAVRMGDWKAIRAKAGGPLELYDLAKDLGEEKNVAERHPDVVARIEKLLQTARTESLHWPKNKAAGASTAPTDWPAFRGPGHQGHAAPGAYLTRWGPEENVAWKVQLPGPGASSPVVHGDRVFLTCFTGKKGPEIVRYLMCFERQTGKMLWEQKRPAPQPESNYAGQILQHGMATPTPIVEGNRIYVNFCRGGVFAFDLEGQELWQRELGIFRNGFGSAASPSICDNLVLVNATVEAGAFFALDKRTGATVWRTKLTGDGWATPVVVDTAQGKEIVLNAPDALIGFDPPTGKELWRCDTVGGYTSTIPVVDKDVLYLIGSNFGRKAVAAIRAGGRGDVTKTHVLWTNAKVGASYCSPLLIGEHLYFFSGQATCLNRSTGAVVTQKPLDGITQLYSSPITADGKIYLFTRNEGAYVFAADPKLTVLAHNVLGDTSTINASPAASGGDLFIRSQSYLYCLRKK